VIGLKKDRVSLSTLFITTDVRATGLQSFRYVILSYFGTGTMVDVLKQDGTQHSGMDRLKMSESSGDSWLKLSVRLHVGNRSSLMAKLQ